jgi:hypothetical protein
LRGDDAGHSLWEGLGGVLSSSGISVDEVAQEYGGRTAVVSWSEVSGSGLSDSGTDSTRATDGANTRLLGRTPRVGCASFKSSIWNGQRNLGMAEWV